MFLEFDRNNNRANRNCHLLQFLKILLREVPHCPRENTGRATNDTNRHVREQPHRGSHPLNSSPSLRCFEFLWHSVFRLLVFDLEFLHQKPRFLRVFRVGDTDPFQVGAAFFWDFDRR